MEGSVEFISPEINTQNSRQESLNRQLEKLDQTRPDHQVLTSVLKDIYQNFSTLDQKAKKSQNIRYQPKCAIDDYEYVPVVDAINNIPDPYNLFPQIESVVKDSKNLPNSEITKKITKTISTITDIPVNIEPFQNYPKSYTQLENGNIYNHRNSGLKDAFGLHTNQYKSTPEILDDLEKQDYSDKIDYKNPAGYIILINELQIDDPAVIRTGLHELGHIVEKQISANQKNTEVISALYGIKAGLLMAEVDPQKAADMIHGQIILYNWVLTGTVAP